MLQSGVQKSDFIVKITVSFKEEPNGGFAVFLTDGSKPGDAGKFLGMMTFFGAAHHAGHGHHMDKLTKTFTFDATHELLKAGQMPNLRFQKTGGSGTGLVVENISVYMY